VEELTGKKITEKEIPYWLAEEDSNQVEELTGKKITDKAIDDAINKIVGKPRSTDKFFVFGTDGKVYINPQIQDEILRSQISK